MDQEINEIIGEELGQQPERVETVEQGLMHETFRVETEEDEYILQLSDAGDEEFSKLDRCLEMYKLFKNIVPVPEPITQQTSRLGDKEYVLVKRLKGESADKNISPAKTRKAGKKLAKIHEFKEFEKEGKIIFDGASIEIKRFEESSLRKRRIQKISKDTEILGKAGLTGLSERIRGFFRSYGDRFPEDFRPVICHNDYSPDNLIYQGENLKGVIDWDLAYSSHSQRDLVKAANSFWMHDPCSDRNIRENFYQGYRKNKQLEKSFHKNEPVYRVETLVRMVTSLEELRGLKEREKKIYSEEIERAITRAEDILE